MTQVRGRDNVAPRRRCKRVASQAAFIAMLKGTAILTQSAADDDTAPGALWC